MSAEEVEEKRHFQRIFYHAEAMLIGDEVEFPCRIIDLSMKGCLLEFDQPWLGSAKTLYGLLLKLSDEVSISMTLSFAHAAGTRAGFKCDHIDIDSITNLRRLVELNLGDSAMLERELTALGADKP